MHQIYKNTIFYHGKMISILPPAETPHQPAGHHLEPIHQHEEDQLERKGDGRRGEHHHAQTHQDTGGDKVNYQKGQIE